MTPTAACHFCGHDRRGLRVSYGITACGRASCQFRAWLASGKKRKTATPDSTVRP